MVGVKRGTSSVPKAPVVPVVGGLQDPCPGTNPVRALFSPAEASPRRSASLLLHLPPPRIPADPILVVPIFTIYKSEVSILPNIHTVPQGCAPQGTQTRICVCVCELVSESFPQNQTPQTGPETNSGWTHTPKHSTFLFSYGNPTVADSHMTWHGHGALHRVMK
jgi:hypothetical protein